MAKVEQSGETFEFEDFTPPNKWLMDQSVRFQNWYFGITYHWEENIPKDAPAMYVGNHTIYGMADAPSILNHLYSKHGQMVRGLGDTVNFTQPIWKSMAKWFGTIEGSRENCQKLIKMLSSIQ